MKNVIKTALLSCALIGSASVFAGGSYTVSASSSNGDDMEIQTVNIPAGTPFTITMTSSATQTWGPHRAYTWAYGGGQWDDCSSMSGCSFNVISGVSDGWVEIAAEVHSDGSETVSAITKVTW